MKHATIYPAALLAFASLGPAIATNAISGGYVTNLTYKEIYLVFQLRDKGSNSCAPCPRDPVNLHSGGYCWISTTDSGEVALLLDAQSHNLRVSGRVESLNSDCLMYEMSLQNNR